MPAAWAIAGGAVVGAVGSLWGASKQASAARAQAEEQNKAMAARYQYDLDMWSMKKKQLHAERDESAERILTNARNEGKIRQYRDAQAYQQYQYDLKIRNAQQSSNEIAFQRSEDIYTSQTTLNNLTAKAASDSEIIKLDETRAEMAFNANDTYIELLQAEGKLRARGASGRSAAKGVQVTMADYGRQMEMLNATMDSAGRNTRAVLEEIVRDKTSADLTAYASKMLDPGVLPDPIKPLPLPVAEYDLPRVLQAYDFGPKPVMGVFADPAAAASAAWGAGISGAASSIAGGLSSYGSAYAADHGI